MKDIILKSLYLLIEDSEEISDNKVGGIIIAGKGNNMNSSNYKEGKIINKSKNVGSEYQINDIIGYDSSLVKSITIENQSYKLISETQIIYLLK